MDLIQELLQGNRDWVKRTNETHPDFFDSISKGQTPEFLWIGCSDSRVPATEITGTMPGSIFVHRNIANLVIHTDANMLSVVYYAVKVLRVKHIIVCGHYGCGGILAAMSKKNFGFIDNWLTHIKDVYRIHADELGKISSEEKRAGRLVELNVIEQVYNLTKVSFIQDEWANSEFPHIHGWVYKLTDGFIQDLGVTVNSVKNINPVFHFEK